MEKRAAVKNRRRGLGLNALFWRYLITSGSLAAALCVLWLILFNILVNMGFVMSAYTAVRGLTETERLLQEQTVFDPEAIPHFYEWALVEDGEITDSNMNQKHAGICSQGTVRLFRSSRMVLFPVFPPRTPAKRTNRYAGIRLLRLLCRSGFE